MGLYDREYYREPRQGFSLRPPRTVVGALILVNVVVFLACELLSPQIRRFLELEPGVLRHPLHWYQLLTYGFTHSSELLHVLSNMLALWFLGRDVESAYGPKEFLRFYLVAVVIGGLAWAIPQALLLHGAGQPLLGASGAVAAVVVLFALNYPRRTILLFFVLPVPAWVMGAFLVLMDLAGAVQQGAASNVAYTVHLAGAAFGFLYFYFRWNFGRLLNLDALRMRLRMRSRPWLRVHDPREDDAEVADPAGDDLSEQVDRILEKIHRQGESSLTRKERHILESASREYQRRRRPTK